MSTIRFTLLAVCLGALSFIGVSWANMGFPLMMIGPVALKPDARIPTFEDSVKRGLRKDWENSKTAQSDNDPERDKLRLELLQASNAFALSPCDSTIKKNLVEALTNYITAWHDMAYCTGKVRNCTTTFSERLDIAAATFKTPADINVHKSLREAIEQGGIFKEDFPAAIRDDVFMWTGRPFRNPKGSCGGTG